MAHSTVGRILLSVVVLLAVARSAASQQASQSLISRAVARAGGEAALRAVRTARYEYLTTWYRTSFSGTVAVPVTGTEQNVDLRDYGRRIWRNERRPDPTSPATIVNLVRDTVATRTTPAGAWEPLSGAYVQERREVFLIAPEQILIEALDAERAGTARSQPDTVLAEQPHARFRISYDGIPVTLLLRRTDAQLTGLRYVAAQPWDLGLAAWGEMNVDVWYSRWAVVSGLVLPLDVTIDRVGRPYKQLQILRRQLNVVIAEDSVAITDSLRARYLGEQRRAMFDTPFDSLRSTAEGLITFPQFGAPTGASRLRMGLVLYGAGAASLVAERAIEKLVASQRVQVVAVVLGSMSVANAGGAPAAAKRGLPVFAASSARPYLEAMFRQQRVDISDSDVHWVPSGSWHRIAGDSIWLEPIDLPDAEGALAAWDPVRRVVYAGGALNGAQTRAVLALIAERRWPAAGIAVSGRLVLAPAP